MKPEDLESDWQQLVRRARDDAPPSVDRAALLRAVRTAVTPRPAGGAWIDELAAVFGSPRTLVTCAALACAGLLFTRWELADVNATLPWAQLMADATGGEP